MEQLQQLGADDAEGCGYNHAPNGRQNCKASLAPPINCAVMRSENALALRRSNNKLSAESGTLALC
jgi:hypothetical protein